MVYLSCFISFFMVLFFSVMFGMIFPMEYLYVRVYVNFSDMQIVGSAPGFPHGIIDPIEVCEIDLFVLKLLDLF